MSEQIYDDGRARNLEELLRVLARRILELDQSSQLLANAGELTRLIGDIRSELFHYEVRVTYDTPEIADSRRIIAEALDQEEDELWRTQEWKPGEDEDQKR
jgi:hypothetical protein